ncbi:nickel/cobalt transporter [Acerihabitans arboris]|uniref:Nickel/cobalt efflux system n=1 Tax=Acerihabitans arboris TaxID=2691583 RepID=A0A845STB3_9GAMM|nr:nickel/cobalt transporter [Acerihabitans arboris]NDL65731.1 nickel transporter [Acerihabitans arboris]
MRSGKASQTPANPWLGLWPFWLFLLMLLGALGWISLHWPQIMTQSIEWQRRLHQQMAQLMQQVQLDPGRYGGALLLFSLTYGILHAVGPGHGKVVITTYLATHPSRLKLSLGMTLAASLLQGAMAIVLVTLALWVLRLSSGWLRLGEMWLERGGYLLMVLLGMLLCRRAGLRLWRTVRHRHPPGCGCGHHHLPADDALRAADGRRTRLAVVLAMGVRPCSGAVLVLLFAKLLGVYLWGVLSALAMAAGTSLTLALISMLVFFGRRYAENLTRRHTNGAARALAWVVLSLAGGVLLIVAGALLYGGAQHAVTSGLRPFSH